jgi:hypothetical protein
VSGGNSSQRGGVHARFGDAGDAAGDCSLGGVPSTKGMLFDRQDGFF